jgi:hypothetical protein
MLGCVAEPQDVGHASQWYADARGRSLRVTRHAEAGVIVLSLWDGDRCIGTFQLTADQAAPLIAHLATAALDPNAT